MSALVACAHSTDATSDAASADTAASNDVIFSPAPADASHLVKIASLIDGAHDTIDIAIYSYSDGKVTDALARASARGVKVRFLYEDAGDHLRLEADARSRSTSGRLETSGVDVRFMTKIMHHKFMIIDGPKADATRAASAKLVTGSANWSASAATKYDENTLFLGGEADLVLRFQREFNLLWDHSRDFTQGTFAEDHAPLEITDAMLAPQGDLKVWFTSANFTPRGTTFSLNGNNAVSDAMVAGINGARRSIHIASGHMRSRPVAEALIAKHAASPEVSIRVYLDDQEYIGESANAQQERDLQACLDAATTPTQHRTCTDNGFLFGYELGKAGIDVRYKWYAYRWDASYAPQMHDKEMIVDGETLFTGSYNLSDNAEHATFENMMRFSGSAYAGLIAKYETQFASIYETRRDGALDELNRRVTSDAEFPIVFDPIALTWDEVTALKSLMRSNCSSIDSDAFRTAPGAHKSCHR